MTSAIVTGGTIYYGNDASNLRVYYRSTSNAETIYLYGADGKKLGIYAVASVTNTAIQFTQQGGKVYFAGRLLGVSVDRLGSVRYGGASGVGYQAQYPYGVEYTTTVNDREKYATYTRDSLTGLDYVVNRYYWSLWGRFLSPDPYVGNSGGPGDPADPQSWNRYSYTRNDPVNRLDPSGLTDFEIIISWSPYPTPPGSPSQPGGGAGAAGAGAALRCLASRSHVASAWIRFSVPAPAAEVAAGVAPAGSLRLPVVPR